MNNWDVRPKLKVFIGEDLPDFIVHRVAEDIIPKKEQVDNPYWARETTTPIMHIYNPTLDLDHLNMVVSSLEDHIANTDEDNWLTDYDDRIVTVDDRDHWISIASSRYHGPNCTVHVYFLRI